MAALYVVAFAPQQNQLSYRHLDCGSDKPGDFSLPYLPANIGSRLFALTRLNDMLTL